MGDSFSILFILHEWSAHCGEISGVGLQQTSYEPHCQRRCTLPS